MPNYTPEELADIHYVYGLCDGNAGEAQRVYAIRFPIRRHPDRRTFINTHRRFREGTLFEVADHAGGAIHNVDIDEEILDIVEDNPHISTRRIAARIGVSQSLVTRVLHQDDLYPYHQTPVQELKPEDYPKRVNFCRLMLQRNLRDPFFLRSIIWTDEACFTRDGVTNFHNLHSYSHENPHEKKQASFQKRFSVNVWAGILGNSLIGPKILPQRLNSPNYLHFLIETAPEILDDAPVIRRNRLFYQQDGAPAHYGHIVTDWLNENYPRRWIGRNGPIAWPPRSPDLTPLDFYLWGFMKDRVYTVEIRTREQLLQRIEEAAVEARANMEGFSMTDELKKRFQRCLIENGGHIENIL